MLFINTRRFSAAGLQRSRCHINKGRKRGSATAAGDGPRGTEPEQNFASFDKWIKNLSRSNCQKKTTKTTTTNKKKPLSVPLALSSTTTSWGLSDFEFVQPEDVLERLESTEVLVKNIKNPQTSTLLWGHVDICTSTTQQQQQQQTVFTIICSWVAVTNREICSCVLIAKVKWPPRSVCVCVEVRGRGVKEDFGPVVGPPDPSVTPPQHAHTSLAAPLPPEVRCRWGWPLGDLASVTTTDTQNPASQVKELTDRRRQGGNGGFCV